MFCFGSGRGFGEVQINWKTLGADKFEISFGEVQINWKVALCWAVQAQVLAELVISQWVQHVPVHCHCCPWHGAGGSWTHSESSILWGQQVNMPALQPWEQPLRSCSQGLQRVQTPKAVQSDKAALRPSWKVKSRSRDLAFNQQGTWPGATAATEVLPSKGSWCL